MKYSIFTPTHNPRYINELYKSLLKQTYSNWEWVILANGNNNEFIFNELSEKFKSDSRVKVFKDDNPTINIGYLKSVNTSYCTGDYLVEVDHDDLLTPDALDEINNTVLETNADFIYSDFCNFYPDWTCQVYGDEYGWDNYEFEYNDKTLTAMSGISISPRALYEIFYAPNHIRVWKAEFYKSIGGHDNSMVVCDDHDLVCRTYIEGGVMVKIDKPLYLYRMLNQNNKGQRNSYLELNDKIQSTQREVGGKYFYKLIDEWCDRQSLSKVDLGGAHGCPEGYLSLDMEGDVNIKCDVTKGLPFPDNSIGVIRAYDFLEHISRENWVLSEDGTLSKQNSYIELMNEIYRVLAPNGWLLSSTPSSDGKGAYQDPTHVNFMNKNSFWYFTDERFANFVPEINCRFQDTRIWEHYPSEFHKKHDIKYVYADLMAIKNDSTCGLCKI